MRTFVAILFPADLLRSIQQYNQSLCANLERQQLAQTVRFVNAQNIHLTLRFLGESNPQQIESLKLDLQHLAQKHQPFALQLQGLGCFPNMRKPSVLWTALHGDLEQLQALQQEVETLSQKAGFVAEKRAFQPHVTLARVERSASSAEVHRLGSWVEQVRHSHLAKDWSASLPIAQIALVHSTLTPGGSIYKTLATLPFAND